MSVVSLVNALQLYDFRTRWLVGWKLLVWSDNRWPCIDLGT